MQSVHLDLEVCVEVWVDVRGRALAWEMASVSVIRDTRAICATAVLTATTERRAPTTASEPVQVLHCQTTVPVAKLTLRSSGADLSRLTARFLYSLLSLL